MPSQKIFLSIPKTSFRCPSCNYKHKEESYSKKLAKSEDFYIYKVCIGCKKKIGITVDYQGDVAVWLKRDEKINKQI